MALSYSSALELANRTFRGDLRSLREVLRGIIKGEGYTSGAGAPTSTPVAIGQRYYDTTNKVFYTATGTGSSLGWNLGNGAGLVSAAGAALTLTQALHNGKTILFDQLAGTTVTLPAATGTGAKYRFRTKVLATSNNNIVKVANGTDIIQGMLAALSDNANAMLGWIAGAADDTITLNRTTTGGVTRGEIIEIEDVGAGLFLVTGLIAQNGTEATPFSSTV